MFWNYFILFRGVLIFGKELVCSIDSIGLLFLFLAVFCRMLWFGLSKIAKEIHPVWITALQNIISLFLFLPLVIVFGEPIRQGITLCILYISSIRIMGFINNFSRFLLYPCFYFLCNWSKKHRSSKKQCVFQSHSYIYGNNFVYTA